MRTKGLPMARNEELAKFVTELRNPKKPIDVGGAISRLKELGWEYDANKYPDLFPDGAAEISAPSETPRAPQTAAEAYIWKQGKWKNYLDFLRDLKSAREGNKGDPGTRLVYWAFARHCANPDENRIFDQHALRALWAITGEDWELAEGYLFATSHGKTSPTTKDGATLHQQFLDRLRERFGRKATRWKDVDRLLMPLGKALKKGVQTREDFHQACGRDQ